MDLSNKTKKLSTTEVPKKKKLSFISATSIVVGSSIGAGIFLKNNEILSNTHGSIWMAMIAWFIAIITIICLGLCLAELCSASTKNKLGIIGWIKTFCNEYLYQAGKKFMAYLYLPINFVIMPYYALMTIQEAFPGSQFAEFKWWILALIALAISSWFLLTSGLSTKMTNIQNWIITSIKFIPLVFAAIIGYVYVGMEGHINQVVQSADNPPKYFSELNPILGIFISIPSIFFVFDGFYSTAGLQTEMKEPKKSSLSMLIGLLVVSGIDLLISISLMISGKGSMAELQDWFSSHNCKWVLQTAQVLVAFGIFGIINGFCLYSSNFYGELIDTNDIFFGNLFNKIKSKNSHAKGCACAYILFFILFIFCTAVGIFYLDTNSYGDKGFDARVSRLYSFVDLMANWTSLLAFGCIVASIIGALLNKKTKKIKTENDPKFNWASWVTIIIVCFSIIMVLVQTFGNLALICMNYLNDKDEVVGAIMSVVVLIVFCGIMFVPTKKQFYVRRK